MKRIITTILAALLIISVFSACSKKGSEVTTSTTKTTVSTTQTETTSENSTKKAEKEFEKWDENDLVAYFEKEKVFDNKDNLSVLTIDNELPEGVNAEIDYDNHTNEEIYVLIYYLDADSKNKKTQEIYNQIKKNKYAEIEGNDGYQQPFNALIGRFAIFYSSSIDERFIEKFETALDKLIKEKKIKPVYYEKNLDLKQFNQDDNVEVIIGDD